jgi:spermidine synthase
MPGPRFEILAHEPTELGLLCLRRRALPDDPETLVTEVTLDHEFLMSSLHTDSERALASIGLEMAEGSGLDVLIGGLGLGYTASEALASPRTARVEVVEYLPPVVDWLRRGLVPLADALNADPRLSISRGDVFARLAGEPARRHDLILIDVDHSPDDRLGPGPSDFYAPDGLRRAREHLGPGGVLGLWSYEESPPFAGALLEAFREVRVEPVSYRNRHVDEACTDWLFFARR